MRPISPSSLSSPLRLTLLLAATLSTASGFRTVALPHALISRSAPPRTPTLQAAQPTPPASPPPPVSLLFLRDAAVRVGTSSVAAVATWTLVHRFAVSSVAASSLVGLAAGATLPTPLATAAFCGSFCGMSSLAVAPGVVDVAMLGAGAAAILATLDSTNSRLLKGYGGRLGVTAVLYSVAMIAATPSLRAAGLLYQPELARAAFSSPVALRATVVATVLGAAATRGWAKGVMRLDAARARGWARGWERGGSSDSGGLQLAARVSNPVFSASLTGLAFALALGPSRAAAAASAFAGAFVAMSPPDKLRSTRALLLAAGVAGIAQAALVAVGVGAGGKLGAAAALGVFAVRVLRAAAALVLVLRARVAG